MSCAAAIEQQLGCLSFKQEELCSVLGSVSARGTHTALKCV